MNKNEDLIKAVEELLGDDIKEIIFNFDQLTIVVEPNNIKDIMFKLKSNILTKFEQCIDLCGVDYSEYGHEYKGPRFAVVYHLLSLTFNWRIRIKAFIKDDEFPLISSINDIWDSVNWYEREAFDLYGIIFEGHPDLRRILTDYGFIGHPFRKDFPIYGHTEMIYDEKQKRVVYQPVTIEPRQITQHTIREETYSVRD